MMSERKILTIRVFVALPNNGLFHQKTSLHNAQKNRKNWVTFVTNGN